MSDNLITSPSYTLFFVYMQLDVEFFTILALARTVSVGHISVGFRERFDFVSVARVYMCE